MNRSVCPRECTCSRAPFSADAAQDVIQFSPLMATMAQQLSGDPRLVPQLLRHVGVMPMADWLRHVSALGLYSALNSTARPLIESAAMNETPKERYKLRRLLDALEYGSGGDYV